MSLDVSYRILLQDKFSQEAKKITESLKEMSGAFEKLTATETVAISATQSRFARLQKAGTGLTRVGRTLRNSITLPLMAIALAALHARAKFQTLETGFSTMLHSAAKGHELMGKLRKFAAEGVFTFTDVATAGQQMMAANVPLKNMTSNLKMLGNLAAGTGAKISDLVGGFTRVKMMGHAYFMDFRMAGRHGIDLMDQLQRGLGITREQLKKYISQGAISFELYKAALMSMTNKEGKFHDQIKKHLNTLLGGTRKLTDNFEQFLGALGGAIDEQFHVTAMLLHYSEVLRSARLNMSGFIKAHHTLIAVLSKLLLYIAIAGPIMMGLGAIVSAVKILRDIWLGLNAVFLASPIGWIVAGIGLFIYVVYKLQKRFKWLHEAIVITFKVLKMTLMAAFGPLITFVKILEKLWHFLTVIPTKGKFQLLTEIPIKKMLKAHLALPASAINLAATRNLMLPHGAAGVPPRC